jgi:hypothetical protein
MMTERNLCVIYGEWHIPRRTVTTFGEDTRSSIVSHVEFLHFAANLSILSVVFMIIISLMTTPRPERKVRITFPRSGRRHSILFGINIVLY